MGKALRDIAKVVCNMNMSRNTIDSWYVPWFESCSREAVRC
jgi:hypothetical protein